MQQRYNKCPRIDKDGIRPDKIYWKSRDIASQGQLSGDKSGEIFFKINPDNEVIRQVKVSIYAGLKALWA